MTILITGGCGFIGSHLVERLLQDRFDVRIVDDLSTSPLPLSELKTEIGPAWDRLDFYHETIERYITRTSPFLPNNRLTGIYHLASPVGPAGILPYKGGIVQHIVDSTYAVIKLALYHKCRLVYVSTSEVYGGGVDGFCSENTPCVVKIATPSARLEYAIGKLAGEIAVLNTDGLDAVIIRPFNVTGHRQSRKGGFVLPTFVDQALHSENLSVFNGGAQIRAFTHVDDIVDGLLLAMEQGKSGQVFNLGNPANETTILDLAYRVLKCCGQETEQSRINFTDGKAIYGEDYTEAPNKIPDARKAMSELGWQPKKDINQTIQDVIDYERGKNVKPKDNLETVL